MRGLENWEKCGLTGQARHHRGADQSGSRKRPAQCLPCWSGLQGNRGQRIGTKPQNDNTPTAQVVIQP